METTLQDVGQSPFAENLSSLVLPVLRLALSLQAPSLDVYGLLAMAAPTREAESGAEGEHAEIFRGGRRSMYWDLSTPISTHCRRWHRT